MTITLQLDDELANQVKEIVERDGRSLNDVIADLLFRHVIQNMTRAELAESYARFAREHAGRSPEGWKFNREDIYAERLNRYPQR